MNRQEIKTITAAMVEKQTWIRQELKNFLKIWADITDDSISGHSRLILDQWTDENDFEQRMFLKRGYCDIDGEVYHDEWVSWENYINIEHISISRIKEIISAIDANIIEYFKNIQNDISVVGASAEKIRSIIKKLS